MATYRFLIGLLSALYLVAAAAPIVAAGSYEVNAVVPQANLTQAVGWDNGLDGKTVETAGQTVGGICQMTNPSTVISIWHEGRAIGSANCTSGRFDVDIVLEPGANVLVARSATAGGQYGPDSQPITLTLKLPDPVPPAPIPAVTDTAVPDSAAEETVAINAGADSGLKAVPTEPFSQVTSDNRSVEINVTVGGGQSPYIITLNWGDGSVETVTKQQSGTYRFTHTYQQAGNYSVRGAVRDVLGAYTRFEYAVTAADVRPATAAENEPATPKAHTPLPYPLVTAIIVAAGGIGLAGLSYYFGYHRAAGKPKMKAKGTRRARR